jgi:hypothetical protein
MTSLARLDSISLTAELALLIALGVLGAHSVDTWAAEQERQASRAERAAAEANLREALDFAEKFMVHCLSGRNLVVGRDNAVMCIRI